MPSRFPMLAKRTPARYISLIRRQRGQWSGFRRRLASCQPHNSQVDTPALIEIPSLIRYSSSSPSPTAPPPRGKRRCSGRREKAGADAPGDNLPAVVRACKAPEKPRTLESRSALRAVDAFSRHIFVLTSPWSCDSLSSWSCRRQFVVGQRRDAVATIGKRIGPGNRRTQVGAKNAK